MDAPPASFTKIAVLARAKHAGALAYAGELRNIIRRSKTFSCVPPQEADLVILAGGDGFALDALKKYLHREVPFLGISFGNVGFFMNPVLEPAELIGILAEAPAHFVIQTYPLLEVLFFRSEAKRSPQTAFAFNEVKVEHVHGQMLHLDIEIGGEKLNAFSGDAIMVSTSQGTTGYAINTGVGAPAVHPDVPCNILVPISPPKSWHYRPLLFPVVLPLSMPVRIRVLDGDDRPAHIICDGVSQGGVVDALVLTASRTVSMLRLSDPSLRTSYVARLVDKIIGPPRDRPQ